MTCCMLVMTGKMTLWVTRKVGETTEDGKRELAKCWK